MCLSIQGPYKIVTSIFVELKNSLAALICIDVQTVHVLCYSYTDISTELGIHLFIIVACQYLLLVLSIKNTCLEIMLISKVKGFFISFQYDSAN